MDVPGYAANDETLLLIAQRADEGLGRGLLVAGAALAAAGLTTLKLTLIDLAIAAALVALLAGVVLSIRPIVAFAVERKSIVLLKRRYPSTIYPVRIAISDVTEIARAHAHGALTLVIRTRSAGRHVIALGQVSKDEPGVELLINRSGVTFPPDTRDAAAMATAITQVIRSAGS